MAGLSIVDDDDLFGFCPRNPTGLEKSRVEPPASQVPLRDRESSASTPGTPHEGSVSTPVVQYESSASMSKPPVQHEGSDSKPKLPPLLKDTKKWASSQNDSVDVEERGGYNADDFLEPVSEDLMCIICLSVLRDPVLTGCCGSRLCKSCMEGLVRSKFTSGCPHCRKPKTDDEFVYMQDKKLKREMEQFRVKCVHHELGCDWVGELRHCEAHLCGKCGFEVLQCPKECGERMPRFKIGEHLEQSCAKRDYKCPHCEEKGNFDDIVENHYPRCEKFPILCPNRCAFGTLERCKKEWHLKEECPLQVVKCDFFEVGPGCMTEVPRQDLPRHLLENQVAHLGMMAMEMCGLIEQNSAIQEKIEQQDKTIQQFHKEVESLVRTVPLVPIEFTVSAYKRKRDSKFLWLSPPFYTHFEGYKMCLKVYVYGEPKGQYVAVYCVLQRGEYDNKLRFPVDIRVRVQLLDQGSSPDTVCERSQVFRYQRCSVGHLGSSENFSLGWPEFILRDLLENPPKSGPKFMHNNRLQFRVYADILGQT